MASLYLVRILTCCCLLVGAPLCNANEFPFLRFGFGFQKTPTPNAESTLVRVIIDTQLQGEKNTIEINGKPLAEYSTILKISYSSTGIVLDQSGHIMTYLGGYRRWLDIKNIDIYNNGVKWKGNLVGVDQRNGVAVIKIAGGKLRKTPVCDDCELRDGATVMAPVFAKNWQFNQAQVISVGAEPESTDSGGWIMTVDRPFPDIFQPVLTPDHRVLGFIADQDSMGRSNTVYPISQLLASANRILKKGGDIYAGWLGLFVSDPPSSMGSGVLVQNVVPDGPAQKAGLSAGDFIQKYNGQGVSDSGQYVQLVEGSPVGSKADIEIVRQGTPMLLSALIGSRNLQTNRGRLASMPGFLGLAGSAKKPAEPVRNHKLLIGVETLLDSTGLTVTGVERKSPAESAGVLVGDVIKSIDGQAIEGDIDFINFLQTHNWGSRVILQVSRKGSLISLPVHISSTEK